MRLREWYDERVLPRAVDRIMSAEQNRSWRDLACGAAAGTVVEFGFASGINLTHYSPAVHTVLAVEPSDLAWERARDRITAAAARGVRVERVSRDAADLSAVDDGSVDAVVSTWTLCTIPDLQRALAEAGRVLHPDASLHFAEHTISPRPWVASLGHRVQPIWQVWAGGCHLDRDIEAELERAGLGVEITRRRGWFVGGLAR